MASIGPNDILAQLGVLRRYARTLARESDAAEDLVQTALLRALERRGSFRADGNLRGWLLAILHNAFVDAERARRAERAREAAVVELRPAATPAVQEGVVRLGQIRTAFLALPEEQRAALHLVAIEGLSYRAAADVLGVPQGTLMSRIARARAALRALEEDKGAPRAPLTIVGGTDDRTA
jgi:RNA polymerase sigma-70 factor (ECF subfamily)